MARSRRDFLALTAGGIVGTAATAGTAAAATGAAAEPPVPAALPAGAPPAFGTGPGVGPEVLPATIAQAEKLVQVVYSPAERAQAAGNWRSLMAPLLERRTGPRKVPLPLDLAPRSHPLPIREEPRGRGAAAVPRRRDRLRPADSTGSTRGDRGQALLIS